MSEPFPLDPGVSEAIRGLQIVDMVKSRQGGGLLATALHANTNSGPTLALSVGASGAKADETGREP